MAPGARFDCAAHTSGYCGSRIKRPRLKTLQKHLASWCDKQYSFLLAMMKVTVLSIVVLTAAALLDFSEGAGDFFQILDQTTAEYLMSDNNANLHRSSSGAVTGPRNNKYLEASMQIIRGKAMFFFPPFWDSNICGTNRLCYAIPWWLSEARTVDFSMKLKEKTQDG